MTNGSEAPGKRRYDAQSCEFCSASVGSVRDRHVVCRRHFDEPIPDVPIYDFRPGHLLQTVLDTNRKVIDDHPPMLLFEPKKMSEITDEERQAFADQNFDELARDAGADPKD